VKVNIIQMWTCVGKIKIWNKVIYVGFGPIFSILYS